MAKGSYLLRQTCLNTTNQYESKIFMWRLVMKLLDYSTQSGDKINGYMNVMDDKYALLSRLFLYH